MLKSGDLSFADDETAASPDSLFAVTLGNALGAWVRGNELPELILYGRENFSKDPGGDTLARTLTGYQKAIAPASPILGL